MKLDPFDLKILAETRAPERGVIGRAIPQGDILGFAPLWLNLQRSYDLKIEAEAKRDEIARIKPRKLEAA